MKICLWAQLLQLKYDAISRKFIVSLTKLKHDKTDTHTKTNIQTTVEEIHIKWVLLSKPKSLCLHTGQVECLVRENNKKEHINTKNSRRRKLT